ncbi:unnamed protein product [Closterium sp. NIES-53]
MAEWLRWKQEGGEAAERECMRQRAWFYAGIAEETCDLSALRAAQAASPRVAAEGAAAADVDGSGGGMLVLRDVYVNAQGLVFNKSHVFVVDRCGSGQWKQQQPQQRQVKVPSYPPGTRVTVHPHLINLLPYEGHEEEEEDEQTGGSNSSPNGGNPEGQEWVAQAKLHNSKERLVARLLPVLFLLSSALMPAARRFPLLLADRHVLFHLGLGVFGTDLSSLAISPESPLLGDSRDHLFFAKQLYVVSARFLFCFSASHPLLLSSSAALLLCCSPLLLSSTIALGPNPCSPTHQPIHSSLCGLSAFSNRLVTTHQLKYIPPPLPNAPAPPHHQPIHVSSLCGLSAAGRPSCPDALWLALRANHLLPRGGLPILNPDWTPNQPAPYSHNVVLGGQSVPRDWVVVVSLVWSSHVMREGGGAGGGLGSDGEGAEGAAEAQGEGGQGTGKESKGAEGAAAATAEGMQSIIKFLQHIFSKSRVVVYDEHVPLTEARALFSRALLLVGPTSPALSNLIFLPFNATVIEILPYSAPQTTTATYPFLPTTNISSLYSSSSTSAPLPFGIQASVVSQQNSATWHYRLAERAGVRHFLSACDPGRIKRELGEQCHVSEVYSIVMTAVRSEWLGWNDLANVPHHPAFPPAAASATTTAAAATTTAASPTTTQPSPNMLPDFQDTIPGSRLQPRTGTVSAFQQWLSCVATRGEWRYNPTPRVLPWNWKSVDHCDMRHVDQVKGGVAYAEADEIARQGGRDAEKRWRVREELKYEWVVPRVRCPAVAAGAFGSVFGPESEREEARGGGAGGTDYDDTAAGDSAAAAAATAVGADEGLFSRFDGRSLCQLARMRDDGLRIAFLGDSLSKEAHTSFLNNILKHVPKPASKAVTFRKCMPWLGTHTGYCHERFTGLGCAGLELHFVFNKRLMPVDSEKDERLWWKNMPWLDDPGIANSHVLVINRGAHATTDERLVTAVQRTLQFVRQNYPEKLVVFRSTAPGHTDCTNATGPIKQRQDLESLPFSWGNFKRQNELLRGVVEEMGAVFMDIEPMTALRPDGHRGRIMEQKTDCLHYCSPGPEDAWSEFLYNIIQRIVPEY